MDAQCQGRQGSRHLIVWFRVVKKPEYTGFIRDSKGKGLVMVREGINTFSAPYLR
jgi:hypothetical protein